jgi:hypothetical protein
MNIFLWILLGFIIWVSIGLLAMAYCWWSDASKGSEVIITVGDLKFAILGVFVVFIVLSISIFESRYCKFLNKTVLHLNKPKINE